MAMAAAPDSVERRERRLRLSLGLLSAAITAHQLVVMQVLGYVHWHHFAYMVVAVALLGFGAAGTVLTLWRTPLLARAEELLPWLMVGTGVAMALGLRLSQQAVFAFDLHLLFVEPRQWLALGFLYVWLLPAFFLGGLATSLILTSRAKRAGRYYFPSLLGAGVGGIAGAIVVEWVTPAQSGSLVALLALATGLGLGPMLSRRGRLACAGVAAAAAVVALQPVPLRPSQFKSVSMALDLPDAEVVAERPSAQGWLQIVQAPGLRPAPPLSLGFVGELPELPAVFINGYGYGSVLGRTEAAAPDWWAWTPAALGWVGAERARVLLLEPGPGGAAAWAVAQGASKVVVVEPHRALAALLTEAEGPWSAEWTLPEVEVVRLTGRHHLRRKGTGFDLIVFPATGTTGGAGLTAATEQFLLTREALQAAFRKLEPGGALVVTAPLEHPVRPALRLLATLVEALEAEGVASPREHLAAVRSWSSVAYLAQREPITPARAASVRAFCDERSFDPLLLPDLRPEERDFFNAWPDPGFFAAVDQLFGPARAELYRDYAFRLQPATDARPWFAQFLRWSRVGALREVFDDGRLPFLELGTLMVALTFGQLAILAVVLVLLPVYRLRGGGAGQLSTVGYFAGLGAGFMLVEIGLMIRLHGWLGSPLLAAALVLAALLVFAGLGSLVSDRVAAGPGKRVAVAGTCLLAIILSGAVIGWLAEVTVGWPLVGQAVLALLAMAPVGFVLGFAFPLGLRELERTAPARVPWAWAINGCVSVATPAGALLLGMEAGITALFVAAAAAYGCAALAAARDAVRQKSARPG